MKDGRQQREDPAEMGRNGGAVDENVCQTFCLWQVGTAWALVMGPHKCMYCMRVCVCRQDVSDCMYVCVHMPVCESVRERECVNMCMCVSVYVCKRRAHSDS